MMMVVVDYSSSGWSRRQRCRILLDGSHDSTLLDSSRGSTHVLVLK